MNQSRGEQFTRRVHEYLAALGHTLQPEFKVSVGLSAVYRKVHRFDLGNDMLLVECKYYDWTAGGNSPSAKISTLNEAMFYFHAVPKGYRKMLFIPKTAKRGTRLAETLGEYYIRQQRHFIPDDVEIWEFDDLAMDARRILN